MFRNVRQLELLYNVKNTYEEVIALLKLQAVISLQLY